MKSFVFVVISIAWAVANPQQATSLGKIEVTGIEPSRLVIIDGKEYEIGAVPITTYDAMILCNALNKTLVSLDDPDKNQLIRDFLVADGVGAERYWTSGSRASGAWLWQGRGSLLKVTDWAAGEPKMFTDCLYVSGNSGWGSETCTFSGYKARYICEVAC